MNPINKALNDLDRAATKLRVSAETGTLTPEVAAEVAGKVEHSAEVLSGVISAAKAALYASN